MKTNVWINPRHGSPTSIPQHFHKCDLNGHPKLGKTRLFSGKPGRQRSECFDSELPLANGAHCFAIWQAMRAKMKLEKKFDASEAEGRIYRQWEESGAFKAGANSEPGADSFCIMIPPPNVTGALHIGHAFNNTLQDVLVRWHRMRRHDVLWQPGQDHAGIATQMVVERELAAEGQPSRQELGRDEFLNQVWSWKEKSGGEIINQLKRLGASCDWSRNRFTMDEGFHDAVLKVFRDLYDKGFIYRGKRLVNWDPHFETAISDIEVEQVEVNGTLWRFRYSLENSLTYAHPISFDSKGNPSGWEERDYLVVATTRPETMLGDTGIAVHPDDARYETLVGKTVRLPLVGRSIPIVADEYADPTKGTGAVKITPAHDFNDWDVGQRAGLRAINVMNPKAEMTLEGNLEFLDGCEPAPEALTLDGLDRYDARKKIVAFAQAQGWLDGADPDQHAVPHGDRSKTAVEPYLTNQWFVDAKKIVGAAMDAVKSGRTRIIPDQYAKLYFNWLENIEPWCISRQLWWGHQIPVWYDEEGNQYCALSEAEARAMAGGRVLQRDPDVLDTWFSSGLWPIGTLGWPAETPELQRYFPTDVLVTGFDILFFWVARMMMMQLAVVEEIPFRTVYVHALVRDEDGKKMAKSLGNVIDPLELVEKYGADSVRFTLATMAAMGRDLRLAESRVEGYRNFGTKIWNAVRLAGLNGCRMSQGFDPADNREAVNKWIVGETVRAIEAVDRALDNFRFNDAANAIYAFVWGRFCDWYLEFAKPLIGLGSTERVEETKSTVAWVIEHCLKLLHPFMPFITEELWAVTGERERMLIHADWPQLATAGLVDEQADREINRIIRLVEEIRSVRTQMRIPAGARIQLLAIKLDEASRQSLSKNEILVQRLARVERVEDGGIAPPDSVTISVDWGEFCLPLADVIDVSEERARLAKALGKAKEDIEILQNRLQNPKFASGAPEHVVEETRGRVERRRSEADVLQSALYRLKTGD